MARAGSQKRGAPTAPTPKRSPSVSKRSASPAPTSKSSKKLEEPAPPTGTSSTPSTTPRRVPSQPPTFTLVDQFLPLILVLFAFYHESVISSSLSQVLPKGWQYFASLDFLRADFLVLLVLTLELCVSRHTPGNYATLVSLYTRAMAPIKGFLPAVASLEGALTPVALSRCLSYAAAAFVVVALVLPAPTITMPDPQSKAKSWFHSQWLWDGLYHAMHGSVCEPLGVLGKAMGWSGVVCGGPKVRDIAAVMTLGMCTWTIGALLVVGPQCAPGFIRLFAALATLSTALTLREGLYPSNPLHLLLVTGVTLPSLLSLIPAKVRQGRNKAVFSALATLTNLAANTLEWALTTYLTASLCHAFAFLLLPAIGFNPFHTYFFRVWVLSLTSFIATSGNALVAPLLTPPTSLASLVNALVTQSLPASIHLGLTATALYYLGTAVLNFSKPPKFTGPALFSLPLPTLTPALAWASLCAIAFTLTVVTTPTDSIDFIKGPNCVPPTLTDGFGLLAHLLTVPCTGSGVLDIPPLLTLATTPSPSLLSPLEKAWEPTSATSGVSLSTLLHATFLLTSALFSLGVVVSGGGKGGSTRLLDITSWSPSLPTNATKGVILALGLAAMVIQAMTTTNPRGFTAFVGKTTKALLPALKPGVDLGLRAMQALVAYPAYVVIASIAHKKSPGAPLWTALVLVLAVAAVGWRREVWWSHWSHFLTNPDLRVVCVTILGGFALATIQRVVKGYLGRGRKAGEAKSK